MDLDTAQAEPTTSANPADLSTSASSIQSYSLTEVAKFLNVNESTLRNWEKRFGEFLSNYRNQYNHRLFLEADISVLERIKYLLESGMFTVAGVKHMLANKGEIDGIGDSTATKAIMTQQEKEAEEEYKQKLIFALNSLGSELHSLRREVREDLRGSLKAELDHLKLLLFPPEQPKKASWWKWW